MVKVALAQILYKPAIIEKMVDHLAEPGLIQHNMCTASLLETLPEEKCAMLQTLHSQLREGYVVYMGQKLKEICKQACSIHKPDILVFPEYSVPYQCLLEIKEISTNLGIVIVAGTHTVITAAWEYYERAGLDTEIAKRYNGCSISPVFFPNATPDYQVKNDRSIFEITMQESSEGFKCFRSATSCGEPFCFSIVICADALTLSTVGKLNIPTENFMVLSVACSTNTEVFEATAKLFALHKIPMLICNTSQYGGSGIYIPAPVRERFTNSPGQPSYIEAKKEALLFLNFLPGQFFVMRSILDNTVLGNWAVCPMTYVEQPKWKSAYKQVLREVEESLQKGEADSASDAVEIFLSLHAGQIPIALENAFNHFMAHIGNFSGTPLPYILPLKSALLEIHSTEAQMYHEFSPVISFCVEVGEIALPQISALIKQRDQYPDQPILPIQPTLPVSVTRPLPTETESVEFRDRGQYLTQIQDALTDPAVKLILVSGAYGIGKSSTVAMTFKRNLPNWSVKTISLTPTTRFSMVLEYLANAIGHSLKADTLTRNGKKVLKPILDKFTKQILAKDGQAIVIDQIEAILLGLQGKDHTLLTLFRDAIYNLKSGQGKLIFLSDVRFSKDIFPDNSAVRRIVMGRIPENKYIKLILEYEMRKHSMISPGSVPEIPDKLYELVNGHPLTAKLCVDVLARNKENPLKDIALGQVQQQVIKQLMDKICLDNVERKLVCMLSVFRTLIEIPRLYRLLSPELSGLLDDNIEQLYKTSFICAGESTIEIASIFRNHFYEQVPPECIDEYHEYALNYYIALHKELTEQHKFSALVYTEIAYHLARLNRMEELKSYLPGNVNALKQLAKTLYQRDKDYSTALQLYLMLDVAAPGDVEVLSYLGRCYARDKKWTLVKKYFEEAIEVASAQGENTWYLYRDWGHLNVRYFMETDAQEHFVKARQMLLHECGLEDDAGILSAEAVMLERNGLISDAAEKYKAALACNFNHEFTIHNYATLLRRQGDISGASKLEERLFSDSFDALGEPTDSLYSGFDLLDADTHSNNE